MSSLPPEITLASPVVTDPVPAVSYERPWFHSIHILLSPGTPGSALVHWMPWNKDENKFLTDRQSVVEIRDLLPRLENDPEFLALWDAMVAYIHKEMLEQGIAAPLEPAAEPIEE